MGTQTGSDDGRVSLLLELEDAPGALGGVLARFASHGVNLTHIESRPAHDGRFDFFVDCEGSRDDAAIRALLAELAGCTCRLLVLDDREVPWFPRQITELERVVDHVLEAGADLQADHPGFSDPVYRARRAHIESLARGHRFGAPLPVVDYSAEETGTWSMVWERLQPLHARHACDEYRRNLALMQRECAYGAERIPQARDLDAFLQARTGFRLWPVAGLLAARDFLAGLAFRVFFCCQYVRHHSRPLYTPEPDVCHELIGHVPMFADPAFAQLSQEIGLASLGASDAEIEELARCYWFSVEFGLVRPAVGEAPGLKAYGAGLLSSAGELAHACGASEASPAAAPPRFEPWCPQVAARQDFPITEYQPLYFVAESLQDASERMRRHCEQLPRPFHARYNPTTRSIWVDRAVRRGR
ncbi:MAG TPA: ACT domain-containing protein [Pseudomonadales bacterium]|nr:ACT domain-containing protein [Pseudomonadales bacterium]